MSAQEIPFDDPTDEESMNPEHIPASGRKRRMPGQRDFSKHGEALFLHEKRPCAPGAPRKIADLKLGVCICKHLPEWAQPCSPCKWNGGDK